MNIATNRATNRNRFRLPAWLAVGMLGVLPALAGAAEPAGGAGDAAAAPSMAGAEKLGWKLGCQAWTFHHLTLYTTIDQVAALGLKYIELFPSQVISKEKPGMKFDHNSPRDIREQVKAKLKEAGVTPLSYGVVGLGNDETGARKVFEFAKDMGIETIVTEPPLEAAPLLDKLANEYHIKVALHDHPKPSKYWNPETVLQFCEGRSKMVGSCADTGHWYRSGLVPVDCLKKLDGRVIESHFKDLDEKKTDVPFGTGKCDVPGMLAELKRQGFRGNFWIEYEHTDAHLVDNVRQCVAEFAKVSDDLAAKGAGPSASGQ